MARQVSKILSEADTSDLEKQIADQEKIVKRETDKLQILLSKKVKLTRKGKGDPSEPGHPENPRSNYDIPRGSIPGPEEFPGSDFPSA